MECDPARGTVSKTGLEEAITDKTEDRQICRRTSVPTAATGAKVYTAWKSRSIRKDHNNDASFVQSMERRLQCHDVSKAPPQILFPMVSILRTLYDRLGDPFVGSVFLHLHSRRGIPHLLLNALHHQKALSKSRGLRSEIRF